MFKNILDNLKEIEKLDSQNMRGSLACLGKQIEQIWHDGQNLKITKNFKNINKLVILGMGGSGTLPGLILKALFFKELKIPLEVIGDYHVPNYVDKNTLVIASSYSGTTEEPLNAIKEAKNRGAKILALTSGGTLAPWAKKNRVPALVFLAKNNPSNQPRMGVGYMVFGLITLLVKAGLLPQFSKSVVERISFVAKNFSKKFDLKIEKQNNFTKQLAEKIKEQTVWFVGAEHLAGNAHAAANQMNENGKRFASFFLIPELNHHLMEGMMYPKNNKNNLFFIFLESSLYDKRIQKRFSITKQVLLKNKIKFASYRSSGKNKIDQVVEALVFSGYLSYYCALVENLNPSAIPYVDYFKAQLKKGR